MTIELRALVKLLGARRADVAGVTAYTGHRGDAEVTVARLGVGPVRAAEVTERLLDRLEVDHVVVSGIAGGIDARATIGTVILPAEVLDVGTGKRYHPSPLGDIRLEGTVATVDGLDTDPDHLARLVAGGVVAVEMEASGVGRICAARGLPWTVVRVVSDRPDDGDADAPVLDTLRPDGTTDTWAALRLMATHPGRIPALIRLGRGASLASTRAARTTLDALAAR